jgi:hypothetical protein
LLIEFEPPSYTNGSSIAEWARRSGRSPARHLHGKAITEDLGSKLENVTLADLGQAKKITIDTDTRRLSKAPAVRRRSPPA